MTIKDEQIWLDYTRAVKRVSKKARKSMPSNTAPDKSAKRKAAAAPPRFIPQPLPAKSLKESLSQGLERKREKSIRQGSLDIEATLDLHGLTQIEAFDALAAFMKRAASSGKRQLLIITGKGRGGSGVLRGNLENWLGQLSEAKQILALRSAAPKHGGGGAFYVLLRKK